MFGLCNKAATFQKVTSFISQDFFLKFVKIILDDYCLFSTKDEHPSQLLKTVLIDVIKLEFLLNVVKCQFVIPYGKLFGHRGSKESISKDLDKVCKLANLPISRKMT